MPGLGGHGIAERSNSKACARVTHTEMQKIVSPAITYITFNNLKHKTQHFVGNIWSYISLHMKLYCKSIMWSIGLII